MCSASFGLRHALDSHLAVESRVGCQEHRGHTILSEQPLDPVAGIEIYDFNVVNNRMLARKPIAELPFFAKAHVGSLLFEWARERRLVAETFIRRPVA